MSLGVRMKDERDSRGASFKGDSDGEDGKDDSESKSTFTNPSLLFPPGLQFINIRLPIYLKPTSLRPEIHTFANPRYYRQTKSCFRFVFLSLAFLGF